MALSWLERRINSGQTNVFHKIVALAKQYELSDVQFEKKYSFYLINRTNLFEQSLYKHLLTSNIQMIQFWLEYNKMSDLKCMYV